MEAFNSWAGKEEKLLSKLEAKGKQEEMDWHCGVISTDIEKAYFCSQNKTYKICENGFDFVSFQHVFELFEKSLDGLLSLKISNNGGGDGLLNINLNSNDEFGASVSHSDFFLFVSI